MYKGYTSFISESSSYHILPLSSRNTTYLDAYIYIGGWVYLYVYIYICNEKVDFQLHQITMATTARRQKQASLRPVGASLAAGTSPPAQSQNQQKPLAKLITFMDKKHQI